MPRTTVSEVLQRVRRQMAAGFRYEVNLLGANLDGSSTTVTMQYTLAPSVRAGAILSIETEDMRVLDIDAGARTATVIRGWRDSAPVAHVAGTEVEINPRFTGADIYEALVDEISGWPANLYRVIGLDFPISEAAKTIELPALWAPMYGVVSAVRSYNVDASTAWPQIPGRLVRGDEWAGATTGLLVRFTELTFAGNVHIEVAMPFDVEAIDYTTDLVADAGLAVGMVDVAQMGVKLRLMGDQEIHRSARRAQDEPRRAEEVPPGAALSGFGQSYTQYLRRRNEEAINLMYRYPIRMS